MLLFYFHLRNWKAISKLFYQIMLLQPRISDFLLIVSLPYGYRLVRNQYKFYSLPVSRRQLDLWKQASITETVFVYPLTLHQSVHEANQEADANLTNRLLPDSLEEHGTPSLIFATTSLLLLLGLDPQHDYYKANTRMKTGPKHIVLVTDY